MAREREVTLLFDMFGRSVANSEKDHRNDIFGSRHNNPIPSIHTTGRSTIANSTYIDSLTIKRKKRRRRGRERRRGRATVIHRGIGLGGRAINISIDTATICSTVCDFNSNLITTTNDKSILINTRDIGRRCTVKYGLSPIDGLTNLL